MAIQEDSSATDTSRKIRALSEASVRKYYQAYLDIDWDAPEYRLSEFDPCWRLDADDPLGATDWYQAQSADVQAQIGFHRSVSRMKVGIVFENALKRGLLEFAASQPNQSEAFRYAMHEVIEEAQHALMFQEFINRSGLTPQGPDRVQGTLTRVVALMGSMFPELFFLFVLAGEAPIDHQQRMEIECMPELHPLIRRMDQIHVLEEARHLAFAKYMLKERVPKLSLGSMALLCALTPPIFAFMTGQMLQPPQDVVARFRIPDDVVKGYVSNPRHRARTREAFESVREVCEQIGIANRWTRPLWKAFGLL